MGPLKEDKTEQKLPDGFYPKGMEVTRIKPDGTEVKVLNAAGSRLGYKGATLNREQSRRKLRDPKHTNKNRTKAVKPKNRQKKDEEKWNKGFTPTIPPSLSNNTRMRTRQIARVQKAERENQDLKKKREEILTA